MFGYIYIRDNPSYNVYKAFKLGKTCNIPERDSQYGTYTIERGKFILVLEASKNDMDIIERLLKLNFNRYNIRCDGGTEFFNKCIIELIEPYLINMGFKFRRLNDDEIENFTREKKLYSPRDYQIDIINKAIEYYNYNDKGILVLICGIGKTLISLWISDILKSKNILIGVPNILLLKQWKNIVSKIFDKQILIISEGISEDDILDKLTDNIIVITTYTSSYKLLKFNNFNFDMKILDECHHLTSNSIEISKDDKKYVQILNIPSKKQIALSATLKVLTHDKKVISNDNTKYFGEIIDKKSLLWAIKNNIVCDYIIQTLFINDNFSFEKFNIIDDTDKRLFLSAYISLKSVYENHTHHLLVYCNNRRNSLKIIEYIKLFLNEKYFDIPDIYYSNYDSDIKSKDQKEILYNFENSKCAILTCVYCLGEGWDFPLLDGVVFAENMSSNIRIVQSALRASRKNNNDITKIAKIIIPIMNKLEDIDIDYKNISEIINQISIEDENIIEKIKVSKIDINSDYESKNIDVKINKIDNYDETLTDDLKIKIFYKSLTYSQVKNIIFINNIKDKKSYYKLSEIDIRLPKDPQLVFKEEFIDWIDYLNIDRIYYDLETCKRKISEYFIKYPELKIKLLNISLICDKLCEIDNSFPPSDLWNEYYKKDLSELLIIPKYKKSKGIKIEYCFI